jgi:hypothetical protein
LEAPPGFEPGMEVLQTSALPLGDGAVMSLREFTRTAGQVGLATTRIGLPSEARGHVARAKNGAGNGIRTRDFDLGKVALYH